MQRRRAIDLYVSLFTTKEGACTAPSLVEGDDLNSVISSVSGASVAFAADGTAVATWVQNKVMSNRYK
jgi:hypothetical protein